jgi:hypothetical protein
MIAACALVATIAGCAHTSERPTVLRHVSQAHQQAIVRPVATVSQQVTSRVDAYFSAINRSLKSGDVSTLSTFSIPNCPCNMLVRYIAGVYERGYLRGSRFTIDRIHVMQVHGESTLAAVQYTVAAGQQFARSGQLLASFPAGTSTEDMSWQIVGGRWLMTNLVRLS